jgi:acetyl esterase
MNAAFATLPRLHRLRLRAERALLDAAFGSPWIFARLSRQRATWIDGRELDATTAALLAIDGLAQGSELDRYPPPEARIHFARRILAVDAEPPPGVAADDHRVPVSGATVLARVYTPLGLPAPSPAILYLHGGGMVVGSVATHDALCRHLALGARCRVVSFDYRLAPEHPFPIPVEDAEAAFRWLASRAESLGVDPARLALAGDSAGGTLSAVVARRTKDDARPPALQVLIYPAADLTRSHRSIASHGEGFLLSRRMMDWFVGHYLPGRDLRHPDASPLFAGDLRGVAPALVYTAGFDPLRDEGQAYAERLREAGALIAQRELPGLIHGYVQMAGRLPGAARALQEMFADVARALERPAQPAS